ncbi:MAG: hypothetical protein WC666_00730 [Candidatus Paceibacterota bacterium]|jgi:hypothetical protein
MDLLDKETEVIADKITLSMEIKNLPISLQTKILWRIVNDLDPFLNFLGARPLYQQPICQGVSPDKIILGEGVSYQDKVVVFYSGLENPSLNLYSDRYTFIERTLLLREKNDLLVTEMFCPIERARIIKEPDKITRIEVKILSKDLLESLVINGTNLIDQVISALNQLYHKHFLTLVRTSVSL